METTIPVVTALAIYDVGLAAARRLVMDSVSSEHSRAAYGKAIDRFSAWLESATFGPGRPAFSRGLVQQWRVALEADRLAPASINLCLAAIRKLAAEAADNGWLDPQVAAGILRVKGVRGASVRAGNWLTKGQAERLLGLPDTRTLRGARDRAILLTLIGSGLRREELVRLELSQIQTRENRWVLVDIEGKGRYRRSVPIPHWAKTAIDRWTAAAGAAGRTQVAKWSLPSDEELKARGFTIYDDFSGGPLFRPVHKGGWVCGARLSVRAIGEIVAGYGRLLGVPRLGPHDLRRTFAKLADRNRVPLSQIQKSLGHASVETTQVYLGSEQDFIDAPCDHLGLDVSETEGENT